MSNMFLLGTFGSNNLNQNSETTANIGTNKINIRGLTEINDMFYRYKMDRVDITKQNTKFVFNNIDSICASLAREPQHMISFLKKHFGSSFEYKNNVATTTKKDLTRDELQNAIFKYIEENVLCKRCKNPETEYVLGKKRITMVCKACSHKIDV